MSNYERVWKYKKKGFKSKLKILSSHRSKIKAKVKDEGYMLIRKILNQLQAICNKKLVVGIRHWSRREQEKSRGSPLLPFNLGWKILTL
jgi:hypothetical protein